MYPLGIIHFQYKETRRPDQSNVNFAPWSGMIPNCFIKFQYAFNFRHQFNTDINDLKYKRQVSVLVN